MEGADAVAHAGHVLVGELLRRHGHAIQRPGHDDEGAVTALRGAFAEAFVEVEQLAEGRPLAHIHDARVVLRALRRVAVGAVGLQLVGQVAAGDVDRPATGLLHGAPDQLAQSIVVFQRQTGEPDAHQPEIGIYLADEVQRHQRAVVQRRLPLPPGPGGQAAGDGHALNGPGQFGVVGLPEAHLWGAETCEAALGADAGGDVEVVGIHRGVGAGDDDGLRRQRRDLPGHAGVGRSRGFDLMIAAASHLRHDHRRMGHHVSRQYGHVSHPLC